MPWTQGTTRSSGFTVTAAVWNAVVEDNADFLTEVNYTSFSSNVSITATTEGTANQIVTSGAITYEAVPHMIEFFAARYDSPAGVVMHIIVRDSATVLGRLLSVPGSVNGSGMLPFRVTPTAGSHTYNIAAHNASAGTGTIQAGAGGPGTAVPGFIRITRIPT